MTTRNNLAVLLGQDGQADAAIAEWRQLVKDRTRILGVDARDTLATRHNLALALGEAGQIETAIAELHRLAEDRTRTLGAHAHETLETRDDLAHRLLESGRADLAGGVLRELLEDRTRLLGADASDTMVTRHTFASSLGMAGQIEAAIVQFGELLKSQTRVLGADAHETFETRGHIAAWRARGGDHAAAIAQFGRLLQDSSRVLGRNAEFTLIIRHALQQLKAGQEHPQHDPPTPEHGPDLDLHSNEDAATTSARINALLRELARAFPQYDQDQVIVPICMGMIAGGNTVVVAPTERLSDAYDLVIGATMTIAAATTTTLTPELVGERNPNELISPETNFLVLQDLSRFSPSSVALLKYPLDEQQRALWRDGQLEPLPNLMSVMAVIDAGHENREAVASLAPLFSTGVLL